MIFYRHFKGAFDQVRSWAVDFTAALAKKSSVSNLVVVNFSGVSERNDYTAGEGGKTRNAGDLTHYNVEVKGHQNL